MARPLINNNGTLTELSEPVLLTEQGSTPATPSAGILLVYPKSDHKMYTLDSLGVETQLGVGGGAAVAWGPDLGEAGGV